MAKSGKKKTASLASVFDVSSVLSQNHFKPFWDSIRDYFFLVMISTAVYMALSVQPGQHFHCRPLANLQNNLTTDDTTYINAVCFTQYARQRPIEAYAGPLSLASTLVVYILIMLWLSFPSVVDLFTTVRKVDNEYGENDVNLTILEAGICAALLKHKTEDKGEQNKYDGRKKQTGDDVGVSKADPKENKSPALLDIEPGTSTSHQEALPNEQKNSEAAASKSKKVEVEKPNGLMEREAEQVEKVVKICEKLWPLGSKNTALKLYIVRNTLSLVFLVISAFIPLCIWQHQDWFFECHVNINNYRSMACAHLITDTIQPCLILFTLSILVQAPLQLVSLVHLLPAKVKNDGQLTSHFASYSCEISKTTQHIIHRTLSDIESEQSAKSSNTLEHAHNVAQHAIIGSVSQFEGPYNGAYVHEGSPLIGGFEELQIKLDILKSKTFNALAAKDFKSYIKNHENFFASAGKLDVIKQCGCDEFNFNLQETDLNGQSLLYHALKKKWFSGPNFKVIFHVLTLTTENNNLSKDKIVNDGKFGRTIERFLNYEYGEDNALMTDLVGVLKKCENKGDFANYVTMTEGGKFRFCSAREQP